MSSNSTLVFSREGLSIEPFNKIVGEGWVLGKESTSWVETSNSSPWLIYDSTTIVFIVSFLLW